MPPYRPSPDSNGPPRAVSAHDTPVRDAPTRDAPEHDDANEPSENGHAHTERQQHLERLGALKRAILGLLEHALSTAEPDVFYRHVLDEAIRHLPGAHAGGLIARQHHGEPYRLRAVHGYDDAAEIKDVTFPPGVAGFGHPEGCEEVRVVRFPDATPPGYGAEDRRRLRDHAEKYPVAAAMVVPIVHNGVTRAFLTLKNHSDTDAFPEEAVALGRIFARNVETLLQRLDMEERLTRLANLDPLTELPNRRHLREALDARLARDPDHPQAVLYLDLDNLKPINDSLGFLEWRGLNGHAGKLVLEGRREILEMQL